MRLILQACVSQGKRDKHEKWSNMELENTV
jgi:hypothetical protein